MRQISQFRLLLQSISQSMAIFKLIPRRCCFLRRCHAWRHHHWCLRGRGDTWHVATATGDTGSVVATGIDASRRLHGSAGLTSDFSFAELCRRRLQHLQVVRRRLEGAIQAGELRLGGCRHSW